MVWSFGAIPLHLVWPNSNWSSFLFKTNQIVAVGDQDSKVNV